ncbi:MAG TPA: cupin domain-containing protein [Mycobacteriales bacterium]|jgi:Predicted mannose-6-phosphate isomerase
MPEDGFHPTLGASNNASNSALTRPLRHIRAGDLTNSTAQTGGMQRLAAISGDSVGSESLWMGRTHVCPDTRSANHHHGESETAIYVAEGHPVFVFHDGEQEVTLRTEPGDYVFVPPFTPHREENPSPDEEAVVVIARSTQEAIVVNLPSLRAD